jgi:hypothetical protein
MNTLDEPAAARGERMAGLLTARVLSDEWARSNTDRQNSESR